MELVFRDGRSHYGCLCKIPTILTSGTANVEPLLYSFFNIVYAAFGHAETF